MTSWQTLLLFSVAAGAISSSAPETGGAKSLALAQPQMQASAPDSGFSVMTYNVHGLPWPLATGRTEAFARIEERLIRLRSTGAQPHVVVLQEAFTGRARAIGANAGYRYVVDGPDRDKPGDRARSIADISFAAAASFSKGETIGKWMDSGLQILSDYPVLSLQRAAFPAFACAGYDCLANKGALMVTLQVPGQSVPVTIVTTHMNSKKSSGVPEQRSRFAYERQAEALARFVRENHDARTPIVFAGDFNASNVQRRRILAGDVAAASRSGFDSALQTVAARVEKWPEKLLDEAAYVSRRGRDWQFFASGTRAAIAPLSIGIPFGREPDGSMLSDHMGLVISYRLNAKA
jgi:endonuclease/exonuclease/phosphatase family metal-dependent hydrolase